MFISTTVKKAITAVVTLALALSFGLTVHAAEVSDIYSKSGAESALQAPGIEQFNISLQQNGGVNLTVKKITGTSAKLSWQGGGVYLSYTLCRYNDISSSWEPVLTTAKTQAKVTGLKRDTLYKYAVMNSCDGSVLASTELRTGKKKDVPVAVHASSDSVELTVRDAVKGEQAAVYRRAEDGTFTKIGETENGKFVDTDVEEATEYVYKTRQKGVAGKGETVSVTTLKNFALPKDSTGECKTYAYYTAVTAKSSPQYKLLRSEECYTDEETGIRMVDGYYCVALGSFYGKTIGTKYRITLKDGDELKEINVILCDQKSDRHTNATHQYARRNKDVVEFYVEKAKIPSNIRGNYGTLEKFSGEIVKIEQYVEE